MRRVSSLSRQMSTTSRSDLMRCVRVHEIGSASSLKEELVSKPTLEAGQVLVQNEVTGLNFIDTYHRSGLYKVPLPFTLGVEGAGRVIDLGEGVSPDLFHGKRVVYYCAGGAYAEYTKCPVQNIVTIPDDISSQVAVACITQGLTAHYLACSTFPLHHGHTAVVQAASGGTGQLLLQIAKMRGARVIGTSSNAKLETGLRLGADIMLPYDELSPEEIVDKVKQATDGAGADVVYDSVGKRTYETSLNCLKKRGMCVLFGNASGAVPPIDPLALTARGSLFLTRPKLYDYIDSHEDLQKRADELFNWIRDGSLKVTIDREFTLDQARQAHEYIEAGKTKGKVIIRIN